MYIRCIGDVMTKQGQGRYTRDKQIGFNGIVSQVVQINSFIFKKYRNYKPHFYYIDLNAGSGYNDIVNETGSPLVFIDVASRHPNIEFYLTLVEIDKNRITELQKRIEEHSYNNIHCTFLNKDIATLTEHDLNIPYNSMGLLYHDPNGSPEYDKLIEIFNWNNFKKIDMLCRLGAAGVKRPVNCRNSKCGKYFGKPWIYYEQHINKKNWLYQHLVGPSQWTFIMGSNFNLKPLKKFGFFKKEDDLKEYIKISFTNDDIEYICLQFGVLRRDLNKIAKLENKRTAIWDEYDNNGILWRECILDAFKDEIDLKGMFQTTLGDIEVCS